MGKIISLKSEGHQVLIEADEDAQIHGEGLKQVTSMDQMESSLEKMLSIVTPFCNALLKNFDSISRRPHSATAEFGLGFSGEGNAFIVKIAGEASVRVTLQWQAE
jgi:hypothetical protein